MLRFSSLLTAIILGTMSLESVESCSKIDIFSGYRNLDYHQDIAFFLPDNDLSDDIVLDKSKDSISNVNIGLIGIDGQWSYNQFYLAGFADWGWQGGDAQVKQQNTSYPIGDFPIVTTSKGKARSAEVSDYQITLGYLFNYNCVDLSLALGYTYSEQKITHYKSSWQGGLLGFNLLYQYGLWNFAAGYQYQFLHLCFTQSRSEIPLKGHSNNGGSNFAYLAASYPLSCGWNLGFAAEYQNWFSGTYKAKAKDHAFPSDCIHIASKTNISTYSFLGSLGYSF